MKIQSVSFWAMTMWHLMVVDNILEKPATFIFSMGLEMTGFLKMWAPEFYNSRTMIWNKVICVSIACYCSEFLVWRPLSVTINVAWLWIFIINLSCIKPVETCYRWYKRGPFHYLGGIPNFFLLLINILNDLIMPEPILSACYFQFLVYCSLNSDIYTICSFLIIFYFFFVLQGVSWSHLHEMHFY
jgi:hypothetical protein